MISIKFNRTSGSDISLPIPEKSSRGAAGWDIRANLTLDQRGEGVRIKAGGLAAVPTGIRLEIPAGFECQVRSRSGLAKNNFVFVLNAPGTIDSDFRGEVLVLLANLGSELFTVAHGERIAQLVFSAVPDVHFEEVEDLGATDRGSSGLGSTGLA